MRLFTIARRKISFSIRNIQGLQGRILRVRSFQKAQLSLPPCLYFVLGVFWEEDDLVYRDIELTSGQTFLQFSTAILKAYEFDAKHASSFFESNDRWNRDREISSEVLTNKKDAPALAQVKTPVSALIATPTQRFIFVYDREKEWTFLAELIGIRADEGEQETYPKMVRKEGLPPAQYGVQGLEKEGKDKGKKNARAEKENMMDVEEAYDLDADEMAEGYGSEGEGSDSSSGLDE